MINHFDADAANADAAIDYRCNAKKSAIKLPAGGRNSSNDVDTIEGLKIGYA